MSRPLKSVPILAAAVLLAGFLIGSWAVAPSPAQAGSPWPMYRHDPAHTSFNGIGGPRSGRLKWIFSTGKAEKHGGFENDVTIGPDGTLYLGSNNGVLYGLDPKSGGVRWVHMSGFDTFGIYSTAAVDSRGLIIYGAKDGCLYALKPPASGIAMEVVWHYRIGTTIETSPVIAPDGTVYIGADDWKLYAVSPPAEGSMEGRLKWTFQTDGTLISSPALDAEGTIFIGSMDGRLYALADEGAGRPPRLKWTFSTGKRDAEGGIETSPVIAKDAVLVGANDGVLYALEKATGRVRWKLKTWFDSYGIFSNPALAPDGTLYFGPKDGRLLAVGAGGRLAWEHKIGTTIETSPALGADGVVYLGADDGRLYAVEGPKGAWDAKPKLLWSFQTEGTLIGSPVLDSDGTLYQPSMDGKLYAFHDSARPGEAPGGVTGTWYGTYSGASGDSKKITVVAVEREGRLDAVWRLGSGLTGSASGRVEAETLAASGETAAGGCPVAFRVTGSLKGDKVSGSFEAEGCPGTPTTRGTFELKR